MKKYLLKPGFELVFALSLIVILGLPPVLMAQTKKDLQITIINGDTTINGKNIKELSAGDRQDALKDMRHIGGSVGNGRTYGNNDTSTKRKWRKEFRRDGRAPMITENIIIKDSLGNVVAVKPGNLRDNRQKRDFKERRNDDGPGNMGFRDRGFNRPTMGGMRRFERKNSQNFDYVSVDEDGISTHISFHVSEASNDDLKRMPHVEGGKFEIDDLNLVPEFSSGKTLLMFNLSSKAVAEVKLTDDEGKILWTEKSTGGNFTKSFSLGLNGIYYLQIKQGSNIAVKRILKEE